MPRLGPKSIVSFGAFSKMWPDGEKLTRTMPVKSKIGTHVM